jgi:environmental stress-induced protein Ves
MPLITHLPASGYTAMPWRNGAGTTHEIAIDDTAGNSSAPFRWRLSMADLAGDGPFSEIADVDRILVLLSGADVTLTIDGASPAPLARHAAIAFPGDVPTSLTMAPGTGRDLNLMWDRTRASGAVDPLQIGDELRIDAPVAFAIALGGSATVSVDDEEHVLGEQDALQLDGGGLLTVLDGEVYLATIS